MSGRFALCAVLRNRDFEGFWLKSVIDRIVELASRAWLSVPWTTATSPCKSSGPSPTTGLPLVRSRRVRPHQTKPAPPVGTRNPGP